MYSFVIIGRKGARVSLSPGPDVLSTVLIIPPSNKPNLYNVREYSFQSKIEL